ncbi:aldehyde dehydrogenase [bacterium]|nr:aldehyde dehydrogenase [bacterium]RQV95522.1 MAG: aldehyde dehydrogenase [bacterium]
MTHNIIQSVNPATLEVIGEVKSTHKSDIEKIVKTARKAFPVWSKRKRSERSKILRNAQQLLLKEQEAFARLITLEMGRPLVESYVIELEASIDLIGYYADRVHRFLKDRPVPLHNLFFKRRKSKIHFQPLGVLGIITPWNWPLLIPLGSIVPALLSGNTVVFKPSELTPLVGQKMGELFWNAGVPEESFQVIQGKGDVGQGLVQSEVEKVFFTGSTQVGQKVMQQAAHSLKKVVLEMGGNDPAIVCEDADIDTCTSGILWGGFNNCGQNCNAIERVYVHQNIFNEFIEHLVPKIEKLRIGNGLDMNTDVGPLASKMQLHKMKSLMARANRKRANSCFGGHPIQNQKGYFFEPTVILWKNNTHNLFDEEIFGPIIVVTPVENDQQAIQLANQSQYGLAASVWTSNLRHGEWIAKQLETGSVMVNDSVVSFGMTEANWTGIKNSGIGWMHGEKGLDEMVNIQYINEDQQLHSHKFWWFPYEEHMIHGLKAGIRLLFDRRIWIKIRALPKAVSYFWKYLLCNSKHKGKI